MFPNRDKHFLRYVEKQERYVGGPLSLVIPFNGKDGTKCYLYGLRSVRGGLRGGASDDDESSSVSE